MVRTWFDDQTQLWFGSYSVNGHVIMIIGPCQTQDAVYKVLE